MKEENKKDKKIGIITFHNSYNCGSMMQTYALQTILEKKGYNPEIINYYTEGQTQIYKTFFKPDSIKNIIKNMSEHELRIREEWENFRVKNMTEEEKNDKLEKAMYIFKMLASNND